MTIALFSAACGRAAADTHRIHDAREACIETFGPSPSRAATAAATRCTQDPSGAACDPSLLLTFDAARCNAEQRYPNRAFHGGLYYDVIVHRPVYRLYTALEPEDGRPVRPHRHLLLDARTGKLLDMLRADPAKSTVRRVTPDGTEQPLGEYAAFWIVAEDRLVGFDAKIGKRFAEAYKLAGLLPDEGLPFVPKERFELPIHRLVEGRESDAVADAAIEGDAPGTNLRIIAPLPDGGRLELDLVAADVIDDQHGGY